MAVEAEHRIASPEDLLALAYTLGARFATSILPPGLAPRLAALLAQWHFRWASVARQQGLERMRRALSDRPPESIEPLFREHLIRRHEQVLGRILDGRRRRGWNPRLELVGQERVAEALERGRGVVLWCMSFCGPVVAKATLCRAGFALTQLSRASHGGFSSSWVARRWLHRFTVAVEDAYLVERIVIPLGGSLTYLRRLLAVLEGNGCLMIGGEHSGRGNVVAPLLGRDESFATGAPHLALLTGATLLPLSCHRRGPSSYRVVVEEPIAVDRTGDRHDTLRRACFEFASRLERHVRAHPADWERWSAWDQYG